MDYRCQNGSDVNGSSPMRGGDGTGAREGRKD